MLEADFLSKDMAGHAIHDLMQSVERVKDLCHTNPRQMLADESYLIEAYDLLWSTLQSLHKGE